MKSNEIFIQVKPSTAGDYVQHLLRKAGCKITGAGGMVCEEGASRDIWFEPPTGTRFDEFVPVYDHSEPLPTQSTESPASDQPQS